MKKILFLSVLLAMSFTPTFAADLTIKVGETARLSHTPYDPPHDGSERVVYTGAPYVSIVSQSDTYCYVKGLKPTQDDCYVQHRWNDNKGITKTAFLYVKVIEDPNNPGGGGGEGGGGGGGSQDTPVTSIYLDQISSLGVGLSYILKVKVTPSSADPKLKWKTSNSKVATVDGYDTFCWVTAVSPGVVTITATTSNGLSSSTTFTVTEEPIYPNGTMISKSTEGIGVTYKVLDKEKKTCEVYGTSEDNAISSGAAGALTIPGTVNGYTVIGISDYAFKGHRGITSISLPNTLEYIGEYAFFECYYIRSVYITDLKAWCKIKMGDIYSNPIFYAKSLYVNGKEIDEDLVIPDGITTLRQAIISECHSIKTVTLPNSVTSIDKSAFSYCRNLTKVTMGTMVRKVGARIFYGCEKLKDVICMSPYVPTISQYAFSDTNIEGVTLHVPNSSIEDYKNTKPWSDFKEIVGIQDPDGLQVGDFIYQLDDKDMTAAIKNCDFTKLTKLDIPSMVESGGKSYTVNKVDNYAFSGCTKLSHIIIPSSVTSIGDGAFLDCAKLWAVIIGPNIKEIGSMAFSNISKKARIYSYPSKAPKLGDAVFEGLDFTSNSPATLYLRNTPETDTEDYKSVAQWKDFNPIKIENDWTLIDGVLTTSIEGNEWKVYDRDGLPTSTFDYAFKTVIFEPGVQKVVDGICAYNCFQLSSVSFPNSVTVIGKQAFYGCGALTSVTLPPGLETIEEAAFHDSGLQKVEVLAVVPPTASDDVFSNYDITLIVPKNTKDVYLAASPWNKFTTIIESDGTDIRDTHRSKIPAPVFDLQGRKVRSQGESLDGLPKGLYIRNSRKVLIK